MFEIKRYTGGIASTNAFLCRAPEGRFLVDAPEGVLDWLTAAGETVDALLITHAHFDHVLDAAAVQAHYECTAFAFADPSPALTLESLYASFGDAFAVKPYAIQRHLGQGDVLEILGARFEVAHIPGHSTDSIVFHAPAQSCVFGGDVLMAGGIGRYDFPEGDGELLRRGIREKLYTLAPETRLFPGHGPATTIGEEMRSNPMVRP